MKYLKNDPGIVFKLPTNEQNKKLFQRINTTTNEDRLYNIS